MFADPSPILALLAHSRGQPGGEALLDWAARLARGDVAAGTHAFRIPEQDRDDVVSIVLLKLLGAPRRRLAAWLVRVRLAPDVLDDPDFHPDPATLARLDRVARRYTRKMLGSAWLDLDAHRGRDREHETDAVFVEQDRRAPPGEARALYDRALNTLDGALDHVVARRRADEGLLRTSFRELVQLADGTDAWTIVDALLAADPDLDPADATHRRRARDRMYKRHARARGYLHEALDDLEHDGTLDPDAAEAARKLLRAVLVRRRPKGGHDGV